MEVLGAVASSIAVVQALAAGKHAISIFREIPDIQKDFDYLMKELEMIKSMAQAVSRMAPAEMEQGLISTAARNLNGITAELEALLRICSRESGPEGNKMSKTKKIKWLVEKSDIKKLQQRMNQAKETLHFALNSSRAFNDIRFQYLVRYAGADVTSLRVNTEALVGCTHSLDPGSNYGLEDGVPSSEMVSHQDIQDLTIEDDSVVWSAQEGSSQLIRRSVAGYGIYPHDTDICGMGLIEFALDQRLYSALEVLLDIWKNIMTEVGLPGRVAIAATVSLRYHKLDEKQTYLVQKVVDLCRDISEVTTTKVHEAILQCANLQEALQEQPWAINTIDASGDSPLVLATEKNQVSSMEVLISAGADIDQQSYDGWSPLMAAVNAGNVESVKMLLMSRSNVDLCNEEGMTALHWASMKANPEVISLLLAAGASVKQRDNFGDTPLHWLSKSENIRHQDIEAAIEMLLVAGSDLEAQNNFGSTPFLLSIVLDKLEVTRALVNSCCSVNISSHHSRNVLHLAARYASLELLHYISDLDLSGIDPYQGDSFGDTPFDELVRISRITDEWDLVTDRKPGLAEQEAFVELYQGFRDQTLQSDIQNLERVLGALQERDTTVVQKHIALLVEKETRWKRKNMVSWYRAVDKRIQHAEWELATEDIEDHLLDLQEELATPVWEIPSGYGYLWELDDGESVSGEGSENSDNSDNGSKMRMMPMQPKKQTSDTPLGYKGKYSDKTA
ncbi:ankyrin repeat PH SEC7 domain-containing protein [Fusarium napiforme]|uniref:Ankyrin repeat PH SEC7 domain-containing protein n=1 Tax=Fusarium napiforme TaxID=42672 RepID=A0A8H5K1R1_9HYPO|nr:ankyrin repeat PH SEC7 domain-containing protein [Fusarium napiforme]